MSARKKMVYVVIEHELYLVPLDEAEQLDREQHEPDFGEDRDAVLNRFRRRREPTAYVYKSYNF